MGLRKGQTKRGVGLGFQTAAEASAWFGLWSEWLVCLGSRSHAIDCAGEVCGRITCTDPGWYPQDC